MPRNIQVALGRNAKARDPALFPANASFASVGQTVVDSVNDYLSWGLNHDDGATLVQSIHSQNLRDSALFSARSARMAYLLGKACMLGAPARKGVVRAQVIEYGAVAEAILLDLVQSVGINDSPAGCRPLNDTKNRPINWQQNGLFAPYRPGSSRMRYMFDFRWLIDQSERLGAIDSNLKTRVTWLRQSRNLVHPVIPTPQRYTDDIDSSRTAREIVVSLRDAALAFKAMHGLP